MLDSISCEHLSTSLAVRISLKMSARAWSLIWDVQRTVNMACASLQVRRIVCSSMPESLNNTYFLIVNIRWARKSWRGFPRPRNWSQVWWKEKRGNIDPFLSVTLSSSLLSFPSSCPWSSTTPLRRLLLPILPSLRPLRTLRLRSSFSPREHSFTGFK